MKKFLLFVFPLFLPFFITAQQMEAEKAASQTTFINNNGNWFLGISGGIGHLFSEGSDQLNFFDNVQPTVGLSVGKWMSPVWGIRMNITGAKLKGYTTWNEQNGTGIWYYGANYGQPSYVTSSAVTKDHIKSTFLGAQKNSKNDEIGYEYEVPYGAGSLDLLLNVNNLFCTYKEDRVFNFLLFGGLGYAHTFRNGDKDRTAVNSMFVKGGFIADFRLTADLSINFEAQALILPEVFDRQIGGANTHDIVTNALLGLTYKFNPRGFEKAKLYDANEVNSLNNKINALYEENKELKKRPEYCPECPSCPECPQVIVPEKKKFDYLPTPVFFRINSSVIDDAQWRSIEDAVKYLKENPEARLKVTGYADKATGTPAGNKKLSEKRAQAVYDAMVKKYHIAPERIETSFLGDDVQPFSENDWNRVVVFVKE
ncbi:MAG: OmpA family protein [Candidatus Azobacteroides sp.]|nr:OmpA family protein [Candidatus Azobacteroides sp.]